MKNTKYILERSLLEPADIILTSSKTSSSLAIRAATISRYSHAAIYVGDTTIEATLDGVFSKNPQRLVFDRPSDVAVFRSKRTLTEQETNQICSYARSQTGSLYALTEAITIRARSSLGLEETKRQFCSRLVAQSYAFAKFDFINLRKPSYCTPRQLSLCKAFEKIEGVIRPATDDEVAFAKTPDPNIENQRQTYEWLNKVRSIVKEEKTLSHIEIQTINDVNDFLLLHPEFDKQIAGFMKASGYLDFYNHDTEINQFRYNKQLFILVMATQSNAKTFLEFELDKEPNLFTKFTNMLEAFIRYCQQLDLDCFRHHLRLYINLTTGVLVRLDVIAHGYSSIGDHEAAAMINDLSKLVKNVIDAGENCIQELDAKKA
ncbi:hypothetical protein D3C87_55020 [compost metagenome]